MHDSSSENPEQIHVTLKPFLGVPPTTYLPIAYSATLVVVLFLLLILPGLVHPGTVLTVASTPPHAAVSIDGAILGASGEGLFVPAGLRSLVVSKPGYAIYEDRITVDRRLVGSLFFPRRRTITTQLTVVSAEDLIETAMLNFSDWALVGEASGQYQFPPVGRELGLDLGASENTGLYSTFSEIALAHVDSEAQLNDLLAGALLGAAGGAALLAPGWDKAGRLITPVAAARTVASAVRGARRRRLHAGDQRGESGRCKRDHRTFPRRQPDNRSHWQVF